MTTSAVIRILIVDDHPLMREALCAAIEDETDMIVIGEAHDGQEAIDRFRALRPDVAVMDIYMPVKDGVQAIAEIVAEHPDAHIVALTSTTEDGKVAAAVQAGALGYLLKDTHRTELLRAIREVHRGNSFLPPAVALKLMNSMRQSRDLATAPTEPLTDREIEVLKLIGQGATNQEISKQLRVTEGTVRTHVHHILQKLGLENRNQAILYSLKLQGLDPPSR